MIFHEYCLLPDDSYEISYLIFFQKLGKMVQNLLSAAVLIGALNDIFHKTIFSKQSVLFYEDYKASGRKKVSHCVLHAEWITVKLQVVRVDTF